MFRATRANRAFLPVMLALAAVLLQGDLLRPHTAAPASIRAAVRQAQDPPPPMTNGDVMKLAKAGLGDAVIVAAIREAKTLRFDISIDGLVALKQAGVSDAVIAVMQHPERVSAVEVAAVSPPPAGGGTAGAKQPGPLDAYEPGIYLDHGDGQTPYALLEPTVFTQGKTGGTFASAMTYGLYKAKWKAVIRNSEANIRTRNQQPTFYFRFEGTSAGLGSSGGLAGLLAAATSPNEFVLVQMMRKRDSRELIVGEAGALGANTGTRSEDTVPFKVEKIGPGQYRVTPTEVLGPGEFCFFHSAGAAMMQGGAAGKLFDFGVDR